MSKEKGNKEHVFSDKEIAAFVELGEVLRPIADRLVAEGHFKVADGKLVKQPLPCPSEE